eukprot:146236-Lingulodinium_polyedra.AAC.1
MTPRATTSTAAFSCRGFMERCVPGCRAPPWQAGRTRALLRSNWASRPCGGRSIPASARRPG